MTLNCKSRRSSKRHVSRGKVQHTNENKTFTSEDTRTGKVSFVRAGNIQ